MPLGTGSISLVGKAVAITSTGYYMMSAASGQEEGDLSNKDIVTLTEAGLSAATIVAETESSGTDFDSSVTELAALAQSDVNSAVTKAMARTSVPLRADAVTAVRRILVTAHVFSQCATV